jgi:hypothetical protein
MKTASLFVVGLAVAILSIAPANAEKNKNNKITATVPPVLAKANSSLPATPNAWR